MEARWYDKLPDDKVHCTLCPQSCRIEKGKRGFCHARENVDGQLQLLTYGRVCSVASDPIEKKPLYHFFPGREILSIGTWGCNLRCAFCQNCEISQHEVPTREVTPQELVDAARREESVGIAYTYNEPLIGWRWLMECGAIVRAAGLKNVLVTNGYINLEPLEALLPLTDAMNIDIKAFHEGFYKQLCRGRLEPVLKTAERAAKDVHVEVTTLLIPGHNDAPKELDDLATWVAEHCGPETPAHLSAYFPRYQMHEPPTSLATLEHAAEIFRKHLRYVYLGNVAPGAEQSDTHCRGCGKTVVRRSGYRVDTGGMNPDGTCANCGVGNGIVT